MSTKHLLDTYTLSKEQAEALISRAAFFESQGIHASVPYSSLQGKTIALAFFESSTRTRLSFELAARRLGGQIISFQSAGSSLSKGESLLDTLATIDAMGVDIWVVRHHHSGAVKFMTEHSKAVFINAGDGQHQHPTQALLDVFTLYQQWGNIKQKNICIIGDILHSRVARSNIALLQTLGANVGVLCPGTLLPRAIAHWNVKVFTKLKEAIHWADCCNVLRIQRERMEGGLLPPGDEYYHHYGIKAAHLLQKPEMLILHPGPANYGVEIEEEIMDFPQTLIRKQVKNGVAIRMAVLEKAAGLE
jgi:aspartate carbamoyltransferase catalytic subunit